MYPELNGKVIIITGALGNLGTEVVRRLQTEHSRLVLVDRDLDRLHKAINAFGLADADVLATTADVTNKADIEALVANAVGKFGKIDGLINVAGGYRAGKPISEVDEATWDFMLNLNARSIFLISGVVAKSMLDHGIRGRIITVSSRAALRGDAGSAAYSAGKAAALRITESLAAELLEHGITANAVLPSVIDTPQNRQAMPNADFTQWVAPESIADVIAFLLSDGARDISGAAIPIYGRA